MNREEAERNPWIKVFTLILLMFVMIFVAGFGLEYVARQLQAKPAVAESPPASSNSEPPRF